MRPRVFAVQPIPEPPLKVLQDIADVEVFPRVDRQISLAETIEGAKRADYLLALHGNYIPGDVMHANPNLKGLAVLGGNTVKVDFDVALQYKIPVLSSDAASLAKARDGSVSNVGIATCDLTIALMLGFAYRVLDSDRYSRRYATFQEQTMALMGVGCYRKTVGLIGLGRVATHMVPRLRAFQMEVLYTKRTRLSESDEDAAGIEWASLDDILKRSDYVCVMVDYNSSTHHLIGERELALMKPTAYLINSARGRIVDETALIEALKSRVIAGAGLEVFYNEPPVVWDPIIPAELIEMENVILAPHNGGAVYESRANQIMPLALGIKALIQGERPAGLLNPEVYGDQKLYPALYGRGPIVPAVLGGPAVFDPL